MSAITIGQKPPPFRLPSGQGPEIGTEDFAGKSSLIVWFTKGMACPFCRQHMSQLSRGYSQFRSLGAELLEITPSTADRAAFYVKQFKIPFPYLCDPDSRVRRSWALEGRNHSPLWYAKAFIRGAKAPPPPTDYGDLPLRMGDIPKLLVDDDVGFYILDRDGVVRFAFSGPYLDGAAARSIPGNDEIVRELERCSPSAGVA